MSFQPWKQVLPNQLYRNKNDGCEVPSAATLGKHKTGDIEQQSSSNFTVLTHPFDISGGFDVPSSSSQYDSEQHSKQSNQQNNGSKFSIFSQLLNLNKINAFDNLLLNASLTLEDDDLSGDKGQGIKKLMEQAISDDAKQQIAFILDKISTLRPAEKLLLYLKMPGGMSEVDPLKQSQNPLGSRSEISHTINWVRSHLEQDDKVSIPKQDVYEDYVAFCGKINIKPLSTADFGKVMKQVFPDIRPRRLGTRGHSRYCYAAMRKASKLNAPQVPDLTASSAPSLPNTNESDKQDSSWKVIKNWSENLLSSRFESVDDLANHISQISPSSTSSTTISKQILHKKLMQRELKEKKKVNNPPTVKRRRKKRRPSTNSSPDHIQNIYNPNILIKEEKETDGSAMENNTEQSENSSDVPINLSSVRNSHQVSCTPISSSKQHNPELIKSILKNKLTSVTVPQVNPNIAPMITMEQKHEEVQQFIYCKKVRQAQQMKANANLNSTVVSNQYHAAITVPSPSEQMPPARVLKSPIKHKLRKDSVQAKKLKYTEDGSVMNQDEPNDLALKKDELQPLKEDFILPRERFISICNMDRNALDTYLNSNEENSQDLELLQYFDKTNEETIEEDLGTATTSVPLLENYQLNFNESNSTKSDKQEKINHLRTILEERHAGPLNNDPVIRNLLTKEPPQQTTIGSVEVQNYPMNQMSQNYPTLGEKTINQSPNTLRKNFSFVPIPSAAQQSRAVRNVNLMPAFNQNRPDDPFASPRVTTNKNRRPVQQPLNIRSLNSMSLEGMKSKAAIPMLGVDDNTAFCRPSQFKIEPLSAPPSPSMSQQFNFSPQTQPHTHQHNHFQFHTLPNPQLQGTNNYNYSVETRSQSVPPHHSNNIYNYTNYSQSACNSMTHTPVPSEYPEFSTSDTNLLDIFNNEQPSMPSIVKIETSDDVINDLLDNELLSQNSNNSDSTSDLHHNNCSSNFNSRSVPTSPYQHGNNYNNGMSSSFYPLRKSVPNTPITTSSDPFRFSPELQRTRDFLINGFNGHQQQAHTINHNNNVVSDTKTTEDHNVTQIIQQQALVEDVLGLGNL